MRSMAGSLARFMKVTVYGAGGPEVGGEKVRLLKGYAYGGEYYCEALAGAPHLSLTGYLGRKVCVGQAGA